MKSYDYMDPQIRRASRRITSVAFRLGFNVTSKAETKLAVDHGDFLGEGEKLGLEQAWKMEQIWVVE